MFNEVKLFMEMDLYIYISVLCDIGLDVGLMKTLEMFPWTPVTNSGADDLELNRRRSLKLNINSYQYTEITGKPESKGFFHAWNSPSYIHMHTAIKPQQESRVGLTNAKFHSYNFAFYTYKELYNSSVLCNKGINISF